MAWEHLQNDLFCVEWDVKPQLSESVTLNEAVDRAQNCPLYRLMSTYGATHS